MIPLVGLGQRLLLGQVALLGFLQLAQDLRVLPEVPL